MPSLKHTIKTKGLGKTAKRSASLIRRYGASSKKMEQNLNDYVELIERNEVKATFPVPAVTLAKNSDFIKELRSSSVEFALHGYSHMDYSLLAKEDIEIHINKSVKIFKDLGLKPQGFRAPYLKYNDELSHILKRHGINYDSSQAFDSCIYPEMKEASSCVQLILDYYQPVDDPSPIVENGFARIPVWLPDDEILVDRMGEKGKGMTDCWVKMGERALSDGVPFILQLHPERFHICRESLEGVLDWGKGNDAMFLTMGELSDLLLSKRYESKRPVVCITGDLDILSISDLKANSAK